MSMLNKNKVLAVTLLSAMTLSVSSETVTIDPSDKHQNVSFGADIKLTLNNVYEGDPDAVIEKFVDMGMDMIRVPIYTTRTINDDFYEKVYSVSDIAEDNGLQIFASVANGDGDENNNLHHADKFSSALICSSCTYNLYSLNLTAYAKYLDDYLDNMDINDAHVDVLGPYNEDSADDSDYAKIWDQMVRNDFSRIGVETYALLAAAPKIDDVGDRLDIVGAHFYDDSEIDVEQLDDEWATLVAKADTLPTWFTESTRYSQGSTDMEAARLGIEHFIPAIRGGVERVIIYQAANRLVWYNGGTRAYRFSATKNFITNASGQVVTSTSDNSDIKTVSFVNKDNLSINLTNSSDSDKTVTISLINDYKTNGLITRTVWQEGSEGASNSYTLNNNENWNVSVPAGSYVHLDVPVQ